MDEVREGEERETRSPWLTYCRPKKHQLFFFGPKNKNLPERLRSSSLLWTCGLGWRKGLFPINRGRQWLSLPFPLGDIQAPSWPEEPSQPQITLCLNLSNLAGFIADFRAQLLIWSLGEDIFLLVHCSPVVLAQGRGCKHWDKRLEQ